MENAQPEPSMEEILASIRRIISEDEDDQPASEKAASESAESSAVPGASASDVSTGVTSSENSPSAGPVLAAVTSTAVEAKTQSDDAPALSGDVDEVSRKTKEDIQMIKENVATAMEQDIEEEILDQTTAEAASMAFKNLSQSVRVSEGPGRTLEDIVVEMLRPMVKDWLDANLPGIVEEKVEEEVQRVARRRR